MTDISSTAERISFRGQMWVMPSMLFLGFLPIVINEYCLASFLPEYGVSISPPSEVIRGFLSLHGFLIAFFAFLFLYWQGIRFRHIMGCIPNLIVVSQNGVEMHSLTGHVEILPYARIKKILCRFYFFSCFVRITTEQKEHRIIYLRRGDGNMLSLRLEEFAPQALTKRKRSTLFDALIVLGFLLILTLSWLGFELLLTLIR